MYRRTILSEGPSTMLHIFGKHFRQCLNVPFSLMKRFQDFLTIKKAALKKLDILTPKHSEHYTGARDP